MRLYYDLEDNVSTTFHLSTSKINSFMSSDLILFMATATMFNIKTTLGDNHQLIYFKKKYIHSTLLSICFPLVGFSLSKAFSFS